MKTIRSNIQKTQSKSSMIARFWSALAIHSKQPSPLRASSYAGLTYAKSLADLELMQRRSAGTC